MRLTSEVCLRYSLGLLLDRLGEGCYIPSSSRRGGFLGQTTGPFAGDAGHADPQGGFAGTVARVRHSAAYPADLKRLPGDSTRLAVPGAVPAGTPGLDRQRMG